MTNQVLGTLLTTHPSIVIRKLLILSGSSLRMVTSPSKIRIRMSSVLGAGSALGVY